MKSVPWIQHQICWPAPTKKTARLVLESKTHLHTFHISFMAGNMAKSLVSLSLDPLYPKNPLRVEWDFKMYSSKK